MKVQNISINVESQVLEGMFALPAVDAHGVVLFAHGSGSSRFSPRNQEVARVLNDAGFGTLLFDLLSEEESTDRAKVFDIPLLAGRLIAASRWLQQQPQSSVSALPLGYFGASTGAGAALWAAAEIGDQVKAVISRGGRPDLAIPRLTEVTAETLLIVGGDDLPVIELNKDALTHLRHGRMVIIPGATHLFEEPGTLETVARLAVTWFGMSFKKAAKAA